jgi:hypothetical protein
MKRVGGLWAELTSFANLLASAEAAAAGKRKRPDVAAFQMDLESELLRLRRELLEGSYQSGRYRTFTILDPKPRQISAAPFRDRVVHHALTRVLEPVFERRFSRNSFACRAGMGTHKAGLTRVLRRKQRGSAAQPRAGHTGVKEPSLATVRCRLVDCAAASSILQSVWTNSARHEL